MALNLRYYKNQIWKCFAINKQRQLCLLQIFQKYCILIMQIKKESRVYKWQPTKQHLKDKKTLDLIN